MEVGKDVAIKSVLLPDIRVHTQEMSCSTKANSFRHSIEGSYIEIRVTYDKIILPT
jgi:hypothetical protein